jgi:hypothetical protein
MTIFAGDAGGAAGNETDHHLQANTLILLLFFLYAGDAGDAGDKMV